MPFAAGQWRELVAMDACVALGTIAEAEASRQGTRGARVRVLVDVESLQRGSLPPRVRFAAWGTGAALKPGHRILFACRPPEAQSADVILLALSGEHEGDVGQEEGLGR